MNGISPITSLLLVSILTIGDIVLIVGEILLQIKDLHINTIRRQI
jgi:hypothetical protein